jgi:hypothetical protein
MVLDCCHPNPQDGGVAVLSHMVGMQAGSREGVGVGVVCAHWRCRAGEGFLGAGGATACRTTWQAPRSHLQSGCFAVASTLQEPLHIRGVVAQEVASTPEYGRVPVSGGEHWRQHVVLGRLGRSRQDVVLLDLQPCQ